MLQELDLKKAIIAILALTGSIFTLGAVFNDFADLPEQVAENTDLIHENIDAIESTSEKLDAVLCLLVQDQVTEASQQLNPLLCLNRGLNPSSFLPDFPTQPGG